MEHLQHNKQLPQLEYELFITDKGTLIRTQSGRLILVYASTLQEYRKELLSLKDTGSFLAPYISQMLEQSETKFKKWEHERLVKKLTSYRHIKTNQREPIINYSVTGLPPVIRFTIS
ncbi:hypothetical protein FDH01_gp170 [Acinetobacter phage vB_AbaM_ME3]|uniref:Uncharacterized protein n=1 Tax=Acinetobacter phage vB_AbaM_ME3 TaxID=1837876 RepID=A0A172Q0S5_9CAUD|nr:hypothetical protein FDH01_gp170 [Acinetobacter phage vB_AbaM_ME3]AND75452.1 hypothetical protein ME3_291 [Acinetobacter phage vB_AbaM_ME3]